MVAAMVLKKAAFRIPLPPVPFLYLALPKLHLEQWCSPASD
jgi:hypothetical protein